MQPSVDEKKGTFTDELFDDIRQLAVGYYGVPFRFFLLLSGTVRVHHAGRQGNVSDLAAAFKGFNFGVFPNITD